MWLITKVFNEMRFWFLILLFFIISISQTVLAQSITFTGNVYGFIGERVLLLKKASKNVSFEGPISDVKILIKGLNVESNIYTDITGAYSFTLPSKGVYVIDVTKKGYSSVWFLLKYEDEGQKTKFPITSFILKKDDSSINDLGEVIINNGGVLSFKASTATQKKMNDDVFLSNKTLIEKGIEINNSSKKNIGSQTSIQKTIYKNNDEGSDVIALHQKIKEDSIAKEFIQTINAINIDSTASIADIKAQIEESKKTLASLDKTSENYKLLLAQINSAESQILVKQALIESQKNEIGSFKKMLTWLVLFAICAIAALAMLLVFIRAKRKHNLMLDEKNKEITKINSRILSSIKYASIIQTSFFRNKESLQKMFSNSFIFNQPKDMLSGDFYWFGHYNGHKIIAVADCTGHGVPGALLTMLGHTVLEEIIVIQGQVLPSKILTELNKAIMSAFSNQNQVEYGIDITVISVKDGSNELLFSAITNDLYISSDGKLTRHQAKTKNVGIANNQKDFTDQTLTIKQGDCIYLMSDGYCDQFGKQTDKIEKFNLSRLENVLETVSKSSNFSNMDEVLSKEFIAWKGNKDQTDDVLVLGIKI